MAIEDLLHKQGLKRTKLRVALLSCFIESKHALSFFDIKNGLFEDIDKSTLYRNLATFEHAGIIHRINDQSGITKYAYGPIKNEQGGHAHFVCEQCSTVYCMKEVQLENIVVPEGFKKKSVQTIIKGICGNC